MVAAAIFFSGCKPSGEALEEGPLQSSTGLGSPQAPESAQGGEAKPVSVSIASSAGDTFEQNQPASFTCVVSGLTSIPRFEWTVDGVKIPDVTQTINQIFSAAGSHTLQINVFDSQNRLLGSATRIINVTAQAAPAPAPVGGAPAPTAPPPPTAEVVKNLPLTCAAQQMQSLTDLVNQKLNQSMVKSTASIAPLCPSPIQQPGDIFLTAGAEVRLDSSGGISLTKITASGLPLPNGIIVNCFNCLTPRQTDTAWAVLYRAHIQVGGTSVEIKNTTTNLPFFTQDPQAADRYFIDTTVTGALSGATLTIKAVILEFTTIGFGTPGDQNLQAVKKGELGAQTAEFIIFSAAIP